MTKLPVPFTVPPTTRLPGAFSTGIGSPVTIDRNTLARTDTQPITDLNGLERDVLFRTVGPDTACRRRRQMEEGFDGAARLAPGAKLEDLSKQHEHRDDNCGLEVETDFTPVRAERLGEQAWRDCRCDAIQVGRSSAEGDESEHVEAAVDDRCPGAHEERPARPEHDRRREDELRPRGHAWRDEMAQRLAWQHVGDHGYEQRHRERQTDPEPPRHVDELGIAAVVAGDGHRLQSHATDRTAPGLVTDDLRVHRTGPLGPWACRGRPDTLGRRRRVTLRVQDELLAAGFAAKPIHPADGVLHGTDSVRHRSPLLSSQVPPMPPPMMAILIR